MTFLTGENHASPASEADLDLNSSLGPPPRRSSRLNTSSRSSTPSRTEQAKQGPGTRRTQKIPTKPKFTSIKDNDKEDDDAIGESSCRSSRSQNSRKRKVVNAKESPVPTRKSARTGAARSAQAVDDIREFGRDIVSHTALAHSKIACDEMQIESPGAIPASYKPLTHPEEDRFENDEDDLDATLLLDPSRMMWERSKTPDLPAETEEPKTPKTPGRMGRAKKPPKVTGKPAVCLK
ncbi:hypothetical protein DFJ77DRAFT_266053 [Powellomyces hirtus]|nr:hypothetical protein DFJ77DRAFT_266053 [Powellomyces hirtus]